MSEVLTEIGGVNVTIKITAAAVSLAVILLFTALWLAERKKRTGRAASFGEWMNGIGYGLLPAAAVWKAFEHMMRSGSGSEVAEPLPPVPWLTENGLYCPCRIEMSAALLCFIGLSLWLMLRKSEPENRGDLLLVALCLWASVRIVTEDFRPSAGNIVRYIYCSAVMLCLFWWTVRRNRIRLSPARTAADWVAAVFCTGIIAVTAEGILSVGSRIGDLAVIAGCAVLEAALTLIAGSDCRKLERIPSE